MSRAAMEKQVNNEASGEHLFQTDLNMNVSAFVLNGLHAG